MVAITTMEMSMHSKRRQKRLAFIASIEELVLYEYYVPSDTEISCDEGTPLTLAGYDPECARQG